MLVLYLAGQDVLGHPNTHVFMSHCGVHSVYEAAFHGVPVVAVPFQFEQVGGGDTKGDHYVLQHMPYSPSCTRPPCAVGVQGCSSNHGGRMSSSCCGR